jgi:hypothetical protein
MPPESKEVPSDESLQHHVVHLYKLPQQTELEIWAAIHSQAQFNQRHELQLAMMIRRQWIWGLAAVAQLVLTILVLVK